VRYTVSRRYFRSSVSDPIGAARRNFEFLCSYLLPPYQDAKSAFVGGEDRR